MLPRVPKWLLAWALVLAPALSFSRMQASALPPAAAREAAWRENNLGVALLEQFRFADAVAAFRRALAADPALLPAQVNLAIAHFYVPDIPAAKAAALQALAASPDAPHPHYLLALIARSEGQAEEAVPHLQKVLAADPNDLGANVTLGQVYLQLRRFDDAIAAFRLSLAAEPYNVSAAYNLAVALNRADKRDEGQAAMARFQVLRDSPYKTALSSNYLEQGRYAEAVASTGAEPEAVDPKPAAVHFNLKREWSAPEPAAPAAGAAGQAALVVSDLDGDGVPELVVAGPGPLRVLKSAPDGLKDVASTAGIAVDDPLAAVASDYDNDGHRDLLVVRASGLALFRNLGGGRFEDRTGPSGLASPAPPSTDAAPASPASGAEPRATKAPPGATAAFLDVDHDGDLDALAGGFLLRNNGDGTFADVTTSSGLDAAFPALALVPTDFDNRRDLDVFSLARDRARLFRNLRDGSFKDVAGELGFEAAAGPFACAAKGDVNKDGYEDFLLCGEGDSTFATSDGRGRFTVSAAPAAARGALAATLVDYDNDGLLDALVLTARGPRLLRNLGSSFSEATGVAFPGLLANLPLAGAALGVADLDQDGDADVAIATAGRVRVLDNVGGNANRSFALQLKGRVSNRDGVGAKVEIRAGNLRQKLETSAAAPMAAPADVAFGLGARQAPDAVRVIWVSGIVQTEVELAAAGKGGVELTELDRKPSSCPYLYVWNGERFEFVTDFLGGGEMGYQVAPGVYSQPDPVEYVRIAPGRMVPRDGRYELRVTNELEEVLYLDQLRLLAIDHPEDVLVFPDEGMTTPPKPYNVVAARDPRTPVALDHAGRDVTERLRRLDRVFADDLPLERIRGYAREHTLTLDLAALPPKHTRLLLTGWTDYAFSSDNVAASQAGLKLLPPRLEVETAAGEWQTAVPQIGVPVGRPQTIVVDVAGLIGPSRRVRVVTSMRVMWDQVAVAEPAMDVALAPVALEPAQALLEERGFSAAASPDGREPWSFDFARASWLSPWKTMQGRYTRLGDVRRLVAASDDRFVVSKPGDSLALRFDAQSLPTLRRGVARTFLLHGDGFSKEMDINSASPDAVLPLPFHAMQRYPYSEAEVPPDVLRVLDEAASWNTRTVVRPIVPIELHASQDPGR
jgi:tetratricopeptide (TPR) repeat protein